MGVLLLFRHNMMAVIFICRQTPGWRKWLFRDPLGWELQATENQQSKQSISNSSLLFGPDSVCGILVTQFRPDLGAFCARQRLILGGCSVNFEQSPQAIGRVAQWMETG
jgi:hypothetical protein